MKPIVWCVVLLAMSNTFMTVAWYGHLKVLKDRAWLVAVAVSWGIALFEYMLQVPANRIGHTQLSIPQLKIMQEVIALTVFIPISVLFLGDRPRPGYYLASLCMVGAIYFIFYFDS